MDAYTIDGNNILEVYNAIERIKEDILRDPKPVILECMTFRMRGHEEASGTKYVPSKLIEKWRRLDPIKNFETFLLKEKVITESDIKDLRHDIKNEINIAWNESEAESHVKSSSDNELADIYKEYTPKVISPSENKSEKRLVDAISDALRLSLIHI